MEIEARNAQFRRKVYFSKESKGEMMVFPILINLRKGN